MNRRKRQQRAQSLLASARQKQREKEARTARAAERAEKRWKSAQHQLIELGATLQKVEEIVKGQPQLVYKVIYQEHTHTFRARSNIYRWLKHLRHPPRKEEEMSWAERHVWWMIENNRDDCGNP